MIPTGTALLLITLLALVLALDVTLLVQKFKGNLDKVDKVGTPSERRDRPARRRRPSLPTEACPSQREAS